MGDPLSLEEKLKDPEYNNWLKAVLILRELKVGISSFVEVRCREVQEAILQTVLKNQPQHVTKVPVCTECTKDTLNTKTLKKKKGCPEKVCPQNVCTLILEEMKKIHKSGNIEMSRTDVSSWTNISRYWEIARTFMGKEKEEKSTEAADTDYTGLLSIIINCKSIHKYLTMDMEIKDTVFHQVKKLRNKVMHSHDSRLKAALLQDLIKACVQILDDPKTLAADKTAKDAIKGINKIERMLLTVSNVDYQSVFLEVQENQRREISEVKTNVAVLAQKQASQEEDISDLARQHALQVNKLEECKEEEEMEERRMSADKEAGQDKLKNSLLKLYRDKILQEKPNVWFSLKNVLQMVVPLEIREDLEEWMAHSRADRKKDNTSKAKKWTKIKSRREIFFKRSVDEDTPERMKEIYLLGEAGVGKSTFCHQLIDNWCKVQDPDTDTDNDDYLCELKSFPFLFFIQARDAKKSQSVYEMIKTQNCPLQFRPILKEVFTSHPAHCLVLIDGLDEWQSGTRGYQELPNVTEIEGSTILITSRPWKIEALDCDLPSSCRVLENRGLDSDGIENLAGKALEAFTNEDHQCSDCESRVKPFLDQIHKLKLDNLAKIPLILLILIRSWLDGKEKLENARGFIYSGLIESLLIHSDKKVKLSKKWGDGSNPNILPMCFSVKDFFLDYNLLLNDLARLAYDQIFSEETENPLKIRKHILAMQPRVKEHLEMCLKLGLLIESKDETKERCRAFSFPHKTLEEFFCAVHLSGEEFETGLAKFCERVTSPVEVFDLENVVLFLSGMNITRCKTLFDHICSIVFGRKFADESLYPVGWYMRDKLEKIENLAEHCRTEARHSLHTGESQFVIPDMVVDKDTPEHKVGPFCKLGLKIKSLVYDGTVTPFSVVESIITMQHIQRLGIVCTAENTEKYIVCICTYLSDLHQLKSFSFSVASSTVKLPKHVSTKLVSKLGTLPDLVSVYLHRLDLSDINTCQFVSQLTSLRLCNTKSLSPGFVSGLCNQLNTLHMQDVYISPLISRPNSPLRWSSNPMRGSCQFLKDNLYLQLWELTAMYHQICLKHVIKHKCTSPHLSPTAVHQLLQYLMTSSSLQSLKLFLPDWYNLYYTVFDDVLDLKSHTSLHTLELYNMDLKFGVRIHPGLNWSKILMNNVSMSESMWHEFICKLPTEPLQQLYVELWNVKSLNTQTLSYIKDKFCVTEDRTYSTDTDAGIIVFKTKLTKTVTQCN